MKDSARYAKIVEWSEEDGCYVGSCPGLMFGGCHGDDEKAVFDELCQIVDEMIELYRCDNKPLPRPTSGKDFATGLTSRTFLELLERNQVNCPRNSSRSSKRV